MPNTYNGDDTGLTEATTSTITVPADGDDPDAATFNAAYEKLADLAAYFMANKASRGVNFKNTEAIWFLLAGLTGGARVVDYTDLGVAGVNNERALIDTFVGGGGAQVYITPAGAFEIAINCQWIPTPTVKWQRQASGPAMLVRIADDKVYLFQEVTGSSLDEWNDSSWSTQVQLDLSSASQGDLLGMTGAGLAKFGRPREALTVIGSGGAPAFQNSWVAATSGSPQAPGYWVDGFNVCHLVGAVVGGASNSVIFQLPFVPESGKSATFPVATGGGGIETVTVDASGNVSTHGDGTSLFHIWLDGVSFRI